MNPGDPDLFDGQFVNDEPLRLTVVEDDDAPQFTGILDANGARIYRVRERVKMGLHV